MQLPSLSDYQQQFIDEGIKMPLLKVPYKKSGLLAELPSPPKDKTGWGWTEETDPVIYAGSDWPKISIVTPSYNQDQFVEHTIRCTLLQNYPNLELLVIDGGSTDNSRSVIEKYAPWISYWQSKKDNGQSHAINLGFSIASGDYYAWINSDDYYLKDTFFKVIRRFITKKAQFVYGYAFEYKTMEQRFNLLKFAPLLDYFIRIPTLVQPSCFWAASIHQPLWEALQCSLDYELWLRMVKGKRRSLIKEPLSVANIHDDAKTSDTKMKVAWEKDHALICSAEGHGLVYEWNRIMLMHKVYTLINKLI